jgi:hypothetical protein
MQWLGRCIRKLKYHDAQDVGNLGHPDPSGEVGTYSVRHQPTSETTWQPRQLLRFSIAWEPPLPPRAPFIA